MTKNRFALMERSSSRLHHHTTVVFNDSMILMKLHQQSKYDAEETNALRRETLEKQVLLKKLLEISLGGCSVSLWCVKKQTIHKVKKKALHINSTIPNSLRNR